MAARAAALLSALAVAARASLYQEVWPSSAFAPLAAATASLAPGLDFAFDSTSFPALCSVRFTGTIVDANASELLTFTAVSDGGVRLWVDDYLVIDAGGDRGTNASAPATLPSFLNVPFERGVPRALRLEYSRWGGSGPATLQLQWRGNATAPAAVPPAAFAAPPPTPFQAQRAALRDRLEAPAVPWQTYYMHSMGAHVLMPAGLALAASLATADGAAALGNISVFRNGNPALVTPSLRSINGSDYTALAISQWARAPNASVTLQSTVLPGGALALLAACAGSGCSALVLQVEAFMMAERAGALSAGADGRSLHADLPGFAPVTATALGQSVAGWRRVGSGDAPTLALALSDGGPPVGIYAGGDASAPPPTVASAAAAIAAAAAATAAAQAAEFGALAGLWEGTASVIAWNSIFTPYEGVVTPVSHNWDIWRVGYILFEWDSYFLALLGSLSGGRAKDLAYSTLIAVTLGRTLEGFVPNGRAGARATYDRSEPQVGARVLGAIHGKWREDWLLAGLLPVMVTWSDWAWARRRCEGVFASGSDDGLADLMCLGSDPSSPGSDVAMDLQAARYEGMDNSPLYDSPPAAFNRTTHHMNMYDVGATAYFASDAEATIALCSGLGAGAPPPCADALPRLAARLARVQAAMNAHLWSAADGVYYNVLLNGTAIRRLAPTNFMPLLSGTPSDAQAGALVAALASPRGFCVNASHTPAPGALPLVQWRLRSGGGGRSLTCASAACTRAALASGVEFGGLEAAVLPLGAGPAPGLLPLSLWAVNGSASGDAPSALVAGSAPPPGAPGSYALVRQEGWCAAAPPAGPWPGTALSLWRSAALGGAYKTCGSAACEAASAPDWTLVNASMCFAYNASGVDNAPCLVAGASIARSDSAFADQGYWRGRAWAPHHMLLYWALARYAHLPAAAAARVDLVALGRGVHELNWGSGVVCENVDGLVGVCEDSGNADSFYEWGALYGFTAFVEGGVY